VLVLSVAMSEVVGPLKSGVSWEVIRLLWALSLEDVKTYLRVNSCLKAGLL
jgi:hypothetical protein